MEARREAIQEIKCAPSDSDELGQAQSGSSHNFPPTQTLDSPLNSSAVAPDSNPDESLNFDYLSPCREMAPEDQSDSVLFLDAEFQDDDEENVPRSSPVSAVPAYSSSNLSSTPWTSNSSSSGRPEHRSLSAGDTKQSESGRPEPSDMLGEAEPKSLASESPAWLSDPKPANVGAGLLNLGNTCFLNAVLQCLTHTVPLVQGLRSYNHPGACESDGGFCVLCSLRDHIELSLASIGRAISPWKLVESLSSISSNFRRFQQEDAHEFLQCLLDRLESCCIYSKVKGIALSSVDENLVKQVFGGRLISKLQCCNCHHCSDTYEPLIDLSLEIENVGTVPGALQSFTRVERIEDSETKFTCEKCKEVVSLEKQLVLDQVPSVAMFHLKRFKNDGSDVEKIDKFVEFPLELDLLPYTGVHKNCNASLKYDLYAVVVHIGISATSGHYYCFIRCAPDAWYRLDDSKVTRVREDFVLSQEAYILFYAKQGTPWFSSYIEREKSSLDPNISGNSPKSVLDNMDSIRLSSPLMANAPTGVVVKDVEDVVGISLESFNRHRLDDLHKVSTPVPQEAKNSPRITSSEVEKKFSPSVLRDNCNNQELNEAKSSSNKILTPPPSPEIYAEEPAVFTHSIPKTAHPVSEKHASCKRQLEKDLEDSQAHPVSEKHASCKRQLEKELEDSQRKQARKLLKSMPKSRAAQLLAALDKSHHDSSRNSKINRRVELSINRNDGSSSKARHKPHLGSFMRTVAAGSMR
ncbi:Ubiquitinyl hydrolase 1 [Bertholletia excelsa]